MRIRISDLVFCDPKHTPRSLIDKALSTAREQHRRVSVAYVSTEQLPGTVVDPPPPDFHIEISTTFSIKYGATEAWEEQIGEAMRCVRDTKQTFQRRLEALLGFAEVLKDVYGLEPTEEGDQAPLPDKIIEKSVHKIEITAVANDQFRVVMNYHRPRPEIWASAGPRNVLVQTVRFLSMFGKLPPEIREFCRRNEMSIEWEED